MYHLQGSHIKCDSMQLRNVLEDKNILLLYLVLCIMIISSVLLLENLIRCSRYFPLRHFEKVVAQLWSSLFFEHV